jgi:hypothetical protein
MKRRADPERVRARVQRRRERVQADPQLRELERKRKRKVEQAYRAKDPERYKELDRQRGIRYRKRLKEEEPERWQQLLEDMRILSALRRLDAGQAVGKARRRVVVKQTRRVVAVAPVACAVVREVALEDEAMFAKLADVSDRTLRDWRNGQTRKTMHAETAGKIMLALDLFWWEVFDVSLAPSGDEELWRDAVRVATELWGDDTR